MASVRLLLLLSPVEAEGAGAAAAVQESDGVPGGLLGPGAESTESGSWTLGMGDSWPSIVTRRASAFTKKKECCCW